MILVVVGVEAAVRTGGVIVIFALAVALVTALIVGANNAALATIQLVVLQIDTCFAAGVGVTNAHPILAVFLGTAGLIAAAAVRFIGLGIHARLLARQQVLIAAGHTLSVCTKLVTRRAAAATMLRIGAHVDAGVAAYGLALLAREAAVARNAGSLAGAFVVAVSTVLLRAVRVDAKILADHVGRRTFGATGPIDTELVAGARDPARATMLEARIRVDAAAIAEHLEAQAVDHASPVFAHLVIQARLPTAATVHDVQINADTVTIASALRGICADLVLSIAFITVREVGIRFTASSRRNQREQDKPQLLWKCQQGAGITGSMWMP